MAGALFQPFALDRYAGSTGFHFHGSISVVISPCMLDKGIGFIIWDNKSIPIFSVSTWLIIKFDVIFSSAFYCSPAEHTGDGSRILAVSSGGSGKRAPSSAFMIFGLSLAGNVDRGLQSLDFDGGRGFEGLAVNFLDGKQGIIRGV
jgi:hypothetical protein